MLAVCGAALANINSNIKNSTFHATNQLTLRVGRTLEMQSSHYTIAGHTFIVLYEINGMPKDRSHLLIELPLGEAFKELASLITKDLWLYD